MLYYYNKTIFLALQAVSAKREVDTYEKIYFGCCTYELLSYDIRLFLLPVSRTILFSSERYAGRSTLFP